MKKGSISSLCCFNKRLKIINIWDNSFASAKPNVKSHKYSGHTKLIPVYFLQLFLLGI